MPCEVESDVTLPKLSIAAKLYAIFAVMATTTLALAIVVMLGARQHAISADEFESANIGALNAAQVNALIYAVVAESRGLYMTANDADRKQFVDGIDAFNAQIAKVVSNWRKSVRADDARIFSSFSQRIAEFIEHRHELARIGEGDPAEARNLGKAAHPIRLALNADLERLTLSGAIVGVSRISNSTDECLSSFEDEHPLLSETRSTDTPYTPTSANLAGRVHS